MDLNTIVVDDFKALFRRDFPYLPTYDATKTYNTGNRVYYQATGLFYDALVNGVVGVTPGSDGTKWAIAQDDVDNYIADEDITRAFAEAKLALNQAILGSDDVIRMAYLYLTAHFLTNDIRAASGGISGAPSYNVSSRSVGNVSESYAIPTAYQSSPIVNFYAQSAYGAKYLSFLLPLMVGNVGVVCGATQP